MSRRFSPLLAVFALLLGAMCSPSDESEESDPVSQLSGSALIFTAASLTDAFNELKAIFETDHPEATVNLNLGASSGLATSIVEQGGADVFASANNIQMTRVADAGKLDGEAQIFAENKLAIIVAPGNPKGIQALADLATPELKVVLAADEVPVGQYGKQALEKAGITGVSPVSEAIDVKGVVGPVTLGEADAGIVYTTDVIAAGEQAELVEIPDDQNVVAAYPIAVIAGGPATEVGRAFVEFVLSEEGQTVLSSYGFATP